MKVTRSAKLSVIVILVLALAKANGGPLISIGNITIGNTIEQKQQ
ncbi:hypothetical protein [Oceanospirillum beijerinckii]|nr:hypothetical protein [Oceanospirillum beijerinckii]